MNSKIDKPKVGRPKAIKKEVVELTDQQKLIKLNELRKYWREYKRSHKNVVKVPSNEQKCIKDTAKRTKDLAKLNTIKAINSKAPVPKRKIPKNNNMTVEFM